MTQSDACERVVRPRLIWRLRISPILVEPERWRLSVAGRVRL